MKTILETLLKNKNRDIEIMFRCDDENLPKQFGPDLSFSLLEMDKINKVIQVYDGLDLNYDLLIQEFDHSSSSITNVIELKSDNHLNDKPKPLSDCQKARQRFKYIIPEMGSVIASSSTDDGIVYLEFENGNCIQISEKEVLHQAKLFDEELKES